ncbi:hypothetical protein BC940DRAFT_151540 [Gongronella butleri]|nr:hypothetical protein BC940DRAFT_151540 [Gongronella butleri]
MIRGKRKASEQDKKKREPIPTTLDEFGYHIRDDGAVRHKERDVSYEFDYLKKDQVYNEARYRVFIDLLGDVVEQRLQEAPLNFVKAIVPKTADPAKNEPHTFVYMTPNALTTKDKLMLFIPGLGTRIGQWNRRVLCEDNINVGSMLETAREAKEHGYEIIIFNPNGTLWYDNASHHEPPAKGPNGTRAYHDVPENESPEKHCLCVFEQYIKDAPAAKIGVMALGWGGGCFIELVKHHYDAIQSKVVGVSIAQSTHTVDKLDSDAKRTWVHNHVVNWTPMADENNPFGDTRFGCVCETADVELPDYIVWKYGHKMLNHIRARAGDAVSDDEGDKQEQGENA